MGASDARERAVLDSIFGSSNPVTWYVGLTKAVPNDDGTGFTEPVAMGYARVAYTNNTTNFPAAVTTSGRTVVPVIVTSREARCAQALPEGARWSISYVPWGTSTA
jgi:hypothetical protein